MDEAERRAKLQELYDLSQGSDEFEGGVTFEENMDALVVGDWAFFAIDEIGDLALSFHLDSHPVAVARLTRFLVHHRRRRPDRLRVRHRRRLRREDVARQAGRGRAAKWRNSSR